MKWEDLTPQQQAEFTEKYWSQSDQELASTTLMKWLMDDGCWMCKKHPFEDWSKFFFHMKSTHGFDREVVIEMVKETASKMKIGNRPI